MQVSARRPLAAVTRGAAEQVMVALQGQRYPLAGDDAASCLSLESNDISSPSEPSLRSWEVVKENSSAGSSAFSNGSKPRWSGLISPLPPLPASLEAVPSVASEMQDSDVDALVSREALKGQQSDGDNWYPVDSMELDAVLAQELGLSISCKQSARGTSQLEPGSKQTISLIPSVMSLGSFLDEEVPDFPFSSMQKAKSKQAVLPQVPQEGLV
mmetsp:Transcript_28221/g.50944  ORF Transcript_28221/g.50944 Transcript_28221/m.50944 type:complete len:213 (+) Transcript_28221:62-700(+)